MEGRLCGGQMELASVVLLVEKEWILHMFWVSNILVRATQNWNLLAHYQVDFKNFFLSCHDPLGYLSVRYFSVVTTFWHHQWATRLNRALLTYCHCGSHGGLMVSVLDSRGSGPGSSPGQVCILCVFLGKTLTVTLTVPLSTQEYKWVPANCWCNLINCWEWPAID